MQNLNAYTARQRLCTFTNVSLGNQLTETFRKVDCRRGPLHGYLRAVQIVFTGAIHESTPAADLTKETLWGIADQITLRGDQHTWLSAIPGEAVAIQSVIDEHYNLANNDDFPTADVGSTGDSTDFIMSYMIPMSPKSWRPGLGQKGYKDGVFPLASMLDNGEITIDVLSSLGGNWQLYTSTYLTVKVILHTYWCPEVIQPAPWRMDVKTTTDPEVQMPSYFGKPDSFWCTDNAWGAFTLPTSNPQFTVDGQRIEDDMDGARDTFARNPGLLNSIDDIVDNNIYQFIAPQQAHSQFDFISGTVFKVRDANSGQSGGDCVYVIRRFVPLDANQTATYTRQLDARFDPKTDSPRLTIARKPPSNLGLSKDRLAGANVRIRT